MGARQCGRGDADAPYDSVVAGRTPQLRRDRHGFHEAMVSSRKGGNVWELYEKGPQIGRGMSGAVWLATSRTTGERCVPARQWRHALVTFSDAGVPAREDRFAAKTIMLNRMQEGLLDDLRNEICLLRDLDHPNIIKVAVARGVRGGRGRCWGLTRIHTHSRARVAV